MFSTFTGCENETSVIEEKATIENISEQFKPDTYGNFNILGIFEVLGRFLVKKKKKQLDLNILTIKFEDLNKLCANSKVITTNFIINNLKIPEDQIYLAISE